MLKQRLKSHYFDMIEAGADEAGRGCLAGPVTAAAVILSKNFENNLLNDSKQLTLHQRNDLREIILKGALTTGVSHIFEETIDDINILNASILAMHQSLALLEIQPEHIIIDGNRFKSYNEIPYKCIIKGDAKYMSIAAASILAKTYRDEYMIRLHEEFPMYNWAQNKGYPTKEHREAIRKYGPSKYHRKSFRLLPEQLKFDL